MTQNRFHLSGTAARVARAAAAAMIALSACAATAEAGPFNAPGGIASPSVPNTNFVQLKQISGFTGQLALSVSDGNYAPVGNSFNKLAKFRLSVNCPAGYRVHKAGVRIRGADVQNLNLELVSPGDLPVTQQSWQGVYENEPWKFNAVVSAGAAALSAAGNNGPVYVSLDEKLDSRIEFYGWCVETDPLSNGAIYYDSTQDNGDLHPKTRVRYTLHHSIATPSIGKLKLAPTARPASVPERLRHRDRTVSAVPALKAPGACPYDCPPPAPTLRRSN